MKRITKKLVREILEGEPGWDWSYNFKDDQRIVLSSNRRDHLIKASLEAAGIEVVEHRKYEYPCTGYMKLRWKPE